MKRGNVLTQSWRSKSTVFRMYSALTSHGYSKSIKAVKTAEESRTNFVIEIPYLFYLFFSQLDSTLSCKYQGFVYPVSTVSNFSMLTKYT